MGVVIYNSNVQENVTSEKEIQITFQIVRENGYLLLKLTKICQILLVVTLTSMGLKIGALTKTKKKKKKIYCGFYNTCGQKGADGISKLCPLCRILLF